MEIRLAQSCWLPCGRQWWVRELHLHLVQSWAQPWQALWVQWPLCLVVARSHCHMHGMGSCGWRRTCASRWAIVHLDEIACPAIARNMLRREDDGDISFFDRSRGVDVLALHHLAPVRLGRPQLARRAIVQRVNRLTVPTRRATTDRILIAAVASCSRRRNRNRHRTHARARSATNVRGGHRRLRHREAPSARSLSCQALPQRLHGPIEPGEVAG